LGQGKVAVGPGSSVRQPLDRIPRGKMDFGPLNRHHSFGGYGQCGVVISGIHTSSWAAHPRSLMREDRGAEVGHGVDDGHRIARRGNQGVNRSSCLMGMVEGSEGLGLGAGGSSGFSGESVAVLFVLDAIWKLRCSVLSKEGQRRYCLRLGASFLPDRDRAHILT